MKISNIKDPITRYIINKIDQKYSTKTSNAVKNNAVLMSAAAALALEAAALVKKGDKTE